MKLLNVRKMVVLLGCTLFVTGIYAQCPNPVVCSGGMNGDVVSIKIGGVGGVKTTAVYSYDTGIKLNAFGSTPNLVFQSNNSTKMTILSNGNVGIGCTSPSVKLAVNGKIQATEVEIKAGPCSDYVFEKDYKLMNLCTLENYIKENKHLPEVPSAKEFEENGYNIGEMDDVLLRKIEEITLYLIQQEKELKEVKQENQELRNLLSAKN